MYQGEFKMNDDKLYYYTDYNTFKLILENSTLRFKESTSSNDKLDTIQLYDELFQMAKEKLNDKELKVEQKFYFDMLKYNGVHSSRIALVACFTTKADSRMLWDAYTMHRKDREAVRYNGVCIEFSKSCLRSAMERSANIFDVKDCRNITYGFDGIRDYLENIMDAFSVEVEELSKDKDQKQSYVPPIPVPGTKKVLELKKCIVIPLLHLIDEFDTEAPFIKHIFWEEENEIRALLSIKKGNRDVEKLGKNEDGSFFFDIVIDESCINKVILGPEFSDIDIEEVNNIKGKLPFNHLKIEYSRGTNIITNR